MQSHSSKEFFTLYMGKAWFHGFPLFFRPLPLGLDYHVPQMNEGLKEQAFHYGSLHQQSPT